MGNFNPLIDDPPTKFRGGIIKTDFRQGLRYYRIVEKNISDELKAQKIILCLFESVPINDPGLWDFIAWYISGGEKPGEPDPWQEKIFDFDVDSGRIYAAFLQAYNIDLRVVKMHWWVFLELLKSIPGDTQLSNVMEIRDRPIPTKGDPQFINRIKKAKMEVSLNKKSDAEIQEENDREIQKMLLAMGG